MARNDKRNLLVPVLWLVALCLVAGGCAVSSGGVSPFALRPAVDAAPWDNPNLVRPERLDQGYAIVLPGIWGDVPFDYGIVTGLRDANVPAAVELYDWTAPLGFMVYNLRGLDRNREESQRLAQRIVAYLDR